MGLWAGSHGGEGWVCERLKAGVCSEPREEGLRHGFLA